MEYLTIEHAMKVVKNRVLLDDVNLHLERGGIYGFFGINGSGKTMLFRAISGLIKLNAGTITVFGEVIGEEVSFPRNLGIALAPGLWDEYSGFNNLKYLASIRNLIDDKCIYEVLERVGLGQAAKALYRDYSLGMKQRLEIAQAIMESPDLLILDEPANSLDADGVQMVLDVIEEQRARGATVLLASHNISELESICDQSFCVHNGKLSEKGVVGFNE